MKYKSVKILSLLNGQDYLQGYNTNIKNNQYATMYNYLKIRMYNFDEAQASEPILWYFWEIY